METLTKTTFKEKVFDWENNREWNFTGDLPVIVDFYADWCGPCRAQAPILEQLQTDFAGRIHVYKVDTEATPELAQLFGIRGIPSLLFIPMSGKPTMTSGLMSRKQLEGIMGEVLNVKNQH